MKRLLPLLMAGIVFVIALVLIQPESTVALVIASRDLPAGHQITAGDLASREFPKSLAPTGAYEDPTPLVGQVLSIARSSGDIIYPANLGGEKLVLNSDERALAIEVSDSAGLAGLLQPGDMVGVTAVIFDSGGAGRGAFSKTVLNGLRVLYISPDFAAIDPVNSAPVTSDGGISSAGSAPVSGGSTFGTGIQTTSARSSKGTIVLAVPISAQVVAYDFVLFGVESDARMINVIDLLPALDHSQNVELSLFLEPDKAESFTTSGVYLPDLVITPGASPTPTQPRPGVSPNVTPNATPEPAAAP